MSIYFSPKLLAVIMLALFADVASAAIEPTRTRDPGTFDYFTVRDGQDRGSFIQIVNNKGRDLTAYYEVPFGQGTAIEGTDFNLPSGSVHVLAGASVDLPITVYAEQLPHFDFHETLEIMARVVAYESWFEGDAIEERLIQYSLDGLGYRVDRVLSGAFGFEAVGLSSREDFAFRVEWRDEFGSVVDTDEVGFTIYDFDRPPILAIRGTNDVEDFFTNFDPNGIGFGQFDANRDSVEDWFRDIRNPENGDFFLRTYVTGHSLGGALSQWFAAAFTGGGGDLGEIVTFNSPGIPQRNAFDQGASRFDAKKVLSVTHYITSGDLVSLAGERFIGGSPQQINPRWAESVYTGGVSSVWKPGHDKFKHSVPVLTSFIEKEGGRIPNPVEIQTPFHDTVSRLNDGRFNYLAPPNFDRDYYGFMLYVAGLDDEYGPKLAAILAFRERVEANRQLIGDKIFRAFLPEVVPSVVRAWQAARTWAPAAWQMFLWQAYGIAPLQVDLAKASAGIAAQPASFWEAAPKWPEAAWEASERWPDYVWEVMCGDPCGAVNGWSGRQWAASAASDFPWEDSPNWTRGEWESVQAPPVKTILGKVWEDLNGNGLDDAEPGRAGQTIFVDLDRDGFLGDNDIKTTTQVSGNFSLLTGSLSAGRYDIRQVLDDTNWQFTTPPDGKREIELNDDPRQVVENITFGNQCIGDCGGGEEPPDGETIVISPDAFLRMLSDLGQNVDQDTGISARDYVCGTVGMAARGGDILEYGVNTDIVKAFAYPKNGSWHVSADFVTSASRKHESWDVTLLCFRSEVAAANGPEVGKPIFRQSFQDLGDNVRRDTGIPFSEYACGVVGLNSGAGDIQEGGTGDIMQSFLYEEGGTWWIRADFRSHRDGEDWDVDVLCLSTQIASYDEPVPDKPFFFEEYHSLGDNIRFDTGIAFDDYVCGVAGFAALDGDIDEDDRPDGSNLLLAYMYTEDGTWRIRADFRSHHNHEDWDVNILCALRDGAIPDRPFNVSREDRGIVNCMGEGMKCQILKDELINFTGSAIVRGGGYSGSPIQIGRRCASTDAIEVYINDRDPVTGKPLWSWPNLCVLDGQTFTIVSGASYDLRGVSIVGGATRAFELQDPSAPPVMLGAQPRFFPAPWGPGVALTWTPTVHPRAKYYEIQASEDNGATWRVYTRSRDIAHGGWMNHHGNLECGIGFDRCLPSAQHHTYRVRVLNSGGAPLTDWSGKISAVSMDWSDLPGLVNQPPTLQAPGFLSVAFKDKLTFFVEASDAAKDKINILSQGLPHGATLSPTAGLGSVTGVFRWTATEVGMHRVTFSARDQKGAESKPRTTIISVCFDPRDCLR